MSPLPFSFSDKRRRRAEAEGGVKSEAARLLESLGLERDVIESSSAAQLSVGQQQRVAAARALIGSPEIVIADEPTSSLDRNRQAAFLDLLFADLEAAGATLIMVSHDESLAARSAASSPSHAPSQIAYPSPCDKPSSPCPARREGTVLQARATPSPLAGEGGGEGALFRARGRP